MATDTATLKVRLDAAGTPDELLALSDELMPLAGGAMDLDQILSKVWDCIKQGHRDAPKSRPVRCAKVDFIRLNQAIESGDRHQAAASAIHLALWVEAIGGTSSGTSLHRARAAKQQKATPRYSSIRDKYDELRNGCQNVTATRRAVYRWAKERDESNARLPEGSSLRADPLDWGTRRILTATRGMK